MANPLPLLKLGQELRKSCRRAGNCARVRADSCESHATLDEWVYRPHASPREHDLSESASSTTTYRTGTFHESGSVTPIELAAALQDHRQSVESMVRHMFSAQERRFGSRLDKLSCELDALVRLTQQSHGLSVENSPLAEHVQMVLGVMRSDLEYQRFVHKEHLQRARLWREDVDKHIAAFRDELATVHAEAVRCPHPELSKCFVTVDDAPWNPGKDPFVESRRDCAEPGLGVAPSATSLTQQLAALNRRLDCELPELRRSIENARALALPLRMAYGIAGPAPRSGVEDLLVAELPHDLIPALPAQSAKSDQGLEEEALASWGPVRRGGFPAWLATVSDDQPCDRRSAFPSLP